MMMMLRLKLKPACGGRVRVAELGPLAKSREEEASMFGKRENGLPEDGIHLGPEGSKGRPPFKNNAGHMGIAQI